MKRLLLLSLAIFVLLEVIGSLSADWFGYPYSYQTVVIYLYMFLLGGLTFRKEQRLLWAWAIGIPIALLHINAGGL